MAKQQSPGKDKHPFSDVSIEEDYQDLILNKATTKQADEAGQNAGRSTTPIHPHQRVPSEDQEPEITVAVNQLNPDEVLDNNSQASDQYYGPEHDDEDTESPQKAQPQHPKYTGDLD